MIESPSIRNLQASGEGWTVSELADDASWIVSLTGVHQDELKTALIKLKGKPFDEKVQPTKEQFALPTLAKLLGDAQNDVEKGYGVRLFKNFPLDQSEEDCRLMFSGLLSHIGVSQPQTIFGEILQPVQDEGQAKLDEGRGSKHNLGLPIHNDGCDVVGFLCRRTPLSGGHTILNSAAAIHDALLESHPQVLEILYQPFHKAWQDYMFPGGRNTKDTDLSRTWEAPIFSMTNGLLCTRYSRFYIDRAQSFSGILEMSSEQVAALDTLDGYLADENNWQYRRDFEPGDVMLLNNHIVFHSRTEFVNGEALENCRQLYRAWLSMPNSRALAASMKCFFGNVEAGAGRRGGVKEEFMLKKTA